MRWILHQTSYSVCFCRRSGIKLDPETIGLALLILGQVARPSLCQGTPRDIFDRELGGHCAHDGFYLHQVPLEYMAVLARRGSNPGPPIRSCVVYSTDWVNVAPFCSRWNIFSSISSHKLADLLIKMYRMSHDILCTNFTHNFYNDKL